MEKERIVFLDYVRVIACLMVMIVHSSENFYLAPVEGAPVGEMVSVVSKIMTEDAHFWVALLDGFCRMSVPLFMITSAYLLCPMRENQSWGEFYKRRALRIVPPMVFFMILYSALPLLWDGTTTSQAIKDLLYIPLNFPGAGGHLWFLYPLLSLYLLIPMISPWLRHSTKKQELFFLSLFLLSTTISFFERFVGDVFGIVFWNHYHLLFPFAGYVGYLVLGHYIRFHIHWSDAKRWAVGLPCVIIGAIVTILSFYVQIEVGTVQDASMMEIAWCFCTPNVVLLTFGFFLLCTTIHKPCRDYAFVKDASRISFGMYLMHMFFLVMYSGIIGPRMYVGWAIPCIALSTFATCYIVTKIVTYIPGSKWIIG